jgi:hypothetical protein
VVDYAVSEATALTHITELNLPYFAESTHDLATYFIGDVELD